MVKFWAKCPRCGRTQRVINSITCPACAPKTTLEPIGWGEDAASATPVFGKWDTLALAPYPFRTRWLKALGLEVDPKRGVVGEYVVNDDECECPDFAFRGGPCKHLIAWHSVRLGTIVFTPPESRHIAKDLGCQAVPLSFGRMFAIINAKGGFHGVER